MHVLVPGVYFKDTLLIRNFFSIFKPSRSGSEWLMILRWIVERSSNGSARPLGGPGPPIAGFVMVCPWHHRYPFYFTVPFLLLYGTSELSLWIFTPTICSTILQIISASRRDIPLFFFFLFQGRLEIVNGELTIHKVQQADSGMYQCVAENKYAAIYSNAELQILGIC